MRVDFWGNPIYKREFTNHNVIAGRLENASNKIFSRGSTGEHNNSVFVVCQSIDDRFETGDGVEP